MPKAVTSAEYLVELTLGTTEWLEGLLSLGVQDVARRIGASPIRTVKHNIKMREAQPK